MSLYYRGAEIREIDDALYAEWVAAGNPKASDWQPLPAQPEFDPQTHAARWDGAQWVVEAIPIEQMQAQAGAAVQAMIDAVCTSGVPYFRDIFSARGYVGDPNPLRDWSSSVWTTLDEIQADVMAGNRQLPTLTELLAELQRLTDLADGGDV